MITVDLTIGEDEEDDESISIPSDGKKLKTDRPNKMNAEVRKWIQEVTE